MKILIISLSPIASDPRVIRQIEALNEIADVRVLGYSPLPENVKGSNIFQPELLPWYCKIILAFLLACRAHRAAEYIYYEKLMGSCIAGIGYVPDVLVVNDIAAMPVAKNFIRQCGEGPKPIYLDLHEFGPAEGGRLIDRLIKNPFKSYLCEVYLSRANTITTVSYGLVKAYQRLTDKCVRLISNAPFYERLIPSEISEEKVKLVHHGGFGPGRDFEGLIETMEHLGDGFELHFYLMGNDRQLNNLRERARHLPVIFHDPVPTKLLAKELNQYDIGVYLLKADNYNNTHAMPNKLFEFVQARLAIATSPNPEMKSFIIGNKIGVVSEKCTGRSLADAIKAISNKDIKGFKLNADIAAAVHCFETNKKMIVEMATEIVGPKGPLCAE